MAVPCCSESGCFVRSQIVGSCGCCETSAFVLDRLLISVWAYTHPMIGGCFELNGSSWCELHTDKKCHGWMYVGMGICENPLKQDYLGQPAMDFINNHLAGEVSHPHGEVHFPGVVLCSHFHVPGIVKLYLNLYQVYLCTFTWYRPTTTVTTCCNFWALLPSWCCVSSCVQNVFAPMSTNQEVWQSYQTTCPVV